MRFYVTFFVSAAALVGSQNAFAWGERGHHTICEVATHLVRNAQLKSFMQSKGHEFGHLCNIPDIYWRDMGPVAKSGDEAHFLNPENLNYTADSLPTDFQAIVKASGKTPTEVADKLGSLWWRADQFFRNAVEAAKLAKTSALPDKTNEQDRNFAFNKAVYTMITSMGLMGHFVGDASQPFHNSSDYDGWKSGHGGIHAFYESTVVNVMGLELVKEVETAALKLRQSGDFKVSEGTVLERMKVLSISSSAELNAVEQLDVVSAPSTERPHVSAKRGSAQDGAKAFHDFIVPELAHSALLLAAFWDEAFASGGSPDVFKYRSYNYPLIPDFVGLDYVK